MKPNDHFDNNRSPMKKLLLFVFVFILAGCSYTGKIKPDFYKIDTQSNKKIPLRATLVQSESLKAQKIYYADSGYTFDIALQPALTSALHAALSSIFEKVEISSGAYVNEGTDIVIIPEYSTKLVRRNLWTGDRILETTFNLAIKDPKALEDILVHKNTQLLYYTPSGTQIFLDVLTGASLFILSPITVPLSVQVIGTNIEKLTEQDIKVHVDAACSKIGSDMAIVKLARQTEKPLEP